jgi:anthranilate phosphoribosyltransferase
MFGIELASPAALTVAGAEQGTEMLRQTLAGRAGPARDVLALNGGAAIYAGGRSGSLSEGVEVAREVLSAGAAIETLEKLRIASQAHEA